MSAALHTLVWGLRGLNADRRAALTDPPDLAHQFMLLFFTGAAFAVAATVSDWNEVSIPAASYAQFPYVLWPAAKKFASEMLFVTLLLSGYASIFYGLLIILKFRIGLRYYISAMSLSIFTMFIVFLIVQIVSLVYTRINGEINLKIQEMLGNLPVFAFVGGLSSYISEVSGRSSVFVFLLSIFPFIVAVGAIVLGQKIF